MAKLEILQADYKTLSRTVIPLNTVLQESSVIRMVFVSTGFLSDIR